MIRGKRIVTYIFFALLLIVSNDPAFYSPVIVTPPPYFNGPAYGAHHAVYTGHYTSARSVKKEKAKVRYMSGDGSFNRVAFTGKISGTEFADRVKGQHYISVITPNHHLLFKLRGPPATLA